MDGLIEVCVWLKKPIPILDGAEVEGSKVGGWVGGLFFFSYTLIIHSPIQPPTHPPTHPLVPR